MVYTKEDFQTRVGNAGKKRESILRRGYTTQVDKNGIIISKPKPRRMRIPVRAPALTVLGFFLFKALMLSANGPQTYQERLEVLRGGTIVGQMGAQLLAVDPVTQFLSEKMGPLFRG